jgi:hypothetical protein
MRGHLDLAGGDWQMNLDTAWTGVAVERAAPILNPFRRLLLNV